MAYAVPQVIEHFHLTFLDVLRAHLGDRRYILKGGANLRYFFDSVRYSEDLDLDVTGLEADWRFEEQVDRALTGDALSRTLRSAQITIDRHDIGKPKQTATTRRWRVWLTVAGHTDKIRTKLEFSSRDGDTRFRLDAVPAEIVAPYAIRPPLVQHYLLEAATEQKIRALALRPATQARDLFDLDMLLRRRRGGPGLDAIPAHLRREAAEAAVALTWQDFNDQVVPFIDDAVVALYDRTAWKMIRDHVAGELVKCGRPRHTASC